MNGRKTRFTPSTEELVDGVSFSPGFAARGNRRDSGIWLQDRRNDWQVSVRRAVNSLEPARRRFVLGR